MALAAWVLAAGAGRATTLISATEAQLPDPPPLTEQVRGLNAGPSIIQMLPPQGGSIRSPFRLWLKFQGPSDPSTVTLILPKEPAIDLTARIKPFVTEQGIDIPDAEVPPGKYKLRIIVHDASGTPRAGFVVFSVAP